MCGEVVVQPLRLGAQRLGAGGGQDPGQGTFDGGALGTGRAALGADRAVLGAVGRGAGTGGCEPSVGVEHGPHPVAVGEGPREGLEQDRAVAAGGGVGALHGGVGPGGPGPEGSSPLSVGTGEQDVRARRQGHGALAPAEGGVGLPQRVCAGGEAPEQRGGAGGGPQDGGDGVRRLAVLREFPAVGYGEEGPGAQAR